MVLAQNLNRRQYPRVKAPIYFRSARFRLTRRMVIDVSLGGVRIFSDEPMNIDARIDVELFMPDGAKVRCHARVAWIAMLPEGSPARFDVGLQLVQMQPADFEKLQTVLEECSEVMPPPLPVLQNVEGSRRTS